MVEHTPIIGGVRAALQRWFDLFRTHVLQFGRAVRGGESMSANSAIEWTHHTFNPWWGCVKVSPGCEHCYAEGMSVRYGHKVWGPAKTTARRLFGEAHWAEPLKWHVEAERLGERQRVFCASMADVFEDHPQVQIARVRLWALIAATPWLDWLILTKRPEHISSMVPPTWLDQPRANVWYGTSAEDQVRASERVRQLALVPAAIRFLSCEPLLGPLQLDLTGMHWLIVGGESGPGARRMDPAWANSLRRQCEAANVAYFFKQAGSVLAAEWGMPGKGGHDLIGVPAELQERQYPNSPGAVGTTAQTLARSRLERGRELQPA